MAQKTCAAFRHLNRKARKTLPLHPLTKGVFRGAAPVVEGELGRILARFEAEIVVGHPTFRNADNIGRQLSQGLKAAAEVYAGRKVAFVVSDGSWRLDAPDETTLEAALKAAAESFAQMDPSVSENLMAAARQAIVR